MKKGFTLAEVLITLGIIGVVAAIIMPAAVQKVKDWLFYPGKPDRCSKLSNNIR